LTTNTNIDNQNIGQNSPPKNDSNKMNDAYTSRFTYFTQNPHRKFMPLGQSYESALKELLAENIFTLPETQGFELKVKSSWWNKAHYYDFNRCKGHLKSSCIQLKHKIHDLVDQNIIEIEGPQSNTSHGVFKNLLPNYEKGESLAPNGKEKK
jgi:hypothetical protein